ncbi:hypothetical protein DPMN_007724 [Dreissena polymorpha]|uniref:Uncharacterized protein n=1 Tax=Dreissena polymorpha TaxID=45954 RepID=A0A9D4RYY9_DREPO|nr:hypothetical protein DPMN_007724 [Dreissena polymorpha]
MKIEQTRKKNAPPLGSHVFQAKVTIFELIQYIIGTNHLSKIHLDRKINVASRMLTRKHAPPLAAMFFNQPNSSKISDSQTDRQTVYSDLYKSTSSSYLYIHMLSVT